MTLDGTLLRNPIGLGMRSGRDRPYYSGNPPPFFPVQVLADPAGRLIWASPAQLGARHDMGAATEHGILAALQQAQVHAIADTGYQGAPLSSQRYAAPSAASSPTPTATDGRPTRRSRSTNPPSPARNLWGRQRAIEELEDPAQDPLLPDPGHNPGQRHPGTYPCRLRPK